MASYQRFYIGRSKRRTSCPNTLGSRPRSCVVAGQETAAACRLMSYGRRADHRNVRYPADRACTDDADLIHGRPLPSRLRHRRLGMQVPSEGCPHRRFQRIDEDAIWSKAVGRGATAPGVRPVVAAANGALVSQPADTCEAKGICHQPAIVDLCVRMTSIVWRGQEYSTSSMPKGIFGFPSFIRRRWFPRAWAVRRLPGLDRAGGRRTSFLVLLGSQPRLGLDVGRRMISRCEARFRYRQCRLRCWL